MIKNLLSFLTIAASCIYAQITWAEASSTDAWIQSRDTQIPVTLVTPTNLTNEGTPLVILIHGHGGTRHEAGGFTRVAAALADHGIASIRMDFPGCGDSTETFANNNLTNMLADVRAAHDHAKSNLDVDENKIGLLGFSMGGRLALQLANENKQYQTLALWAPAATEGVGNMTRYVGGAQAYAAMKEQARTEGYAPFTTFWGQEQKLGLGWFTDLEASKPRQHAANFSGDLFVLYGNLDDVVLPEVSEGVLTLAKAARSKQRHIVQGADHGLGLFNDDWNASEDAVQSTVEFFKKHLSAHNSQ